MPNYLFLCSAYPKNYDDFYQALSGADSTVSGNIFATSIIEGMQKRQLNYFIISGVSVGHYPLNTKTKRLPEICFSEKFHSVSYNNHVLISHITKARAIVKCFKNSCPFNNQPVNILISDIHEPFLKAALRIKSLNKGSKIVNICLDVPNTIISAHENLLRRTLKKISVIRNLNLLKRADGFILLSELMKEKLPIRDKPYFVFPCISDADIYSGLKKRQSKHKRIVYCGVLSHQYNIDFLLDSFSQIDDPDYRLILAGKGDCIQQIMYKSRFDSRIVYLGELPRDQALQLQLDADVLVNPRLPDKKYTNYSFPSKTLIYLLSGNPLVCYTFSSFPQDIKKMVFEPDDLTTVSLAKAIVEATSKPSKVDIESLSIYSSVSFIEKLVGFFDQLGTSTNE